MIDREHHFGTPRKDGGTPDFILLRSFQTEESNFFDFIQNDALPFEKTEFKDHHVDLEIDDFQVQAVGSWGK